VFSPGIERALRAAHAAHDGQLRKGRERTPYVVHPIHAALILARLGADEETIQAAILHDVVEDVPGWTLARVGAEFSPRVMHIVADLTEDKSKSWEHRKRWAVEHAPHMLPEAALVKAADKLHNLACLAADLEGAEDRAAVWAHFKGGRERTLVLAAELIDALAPRIDPRMESALRDVLLRLEDLS
jgi:(p)ppGpp synthase/HD superfamily hydrolase